VGEAKRGRPPVHLTSLAFPGVGSRHNPRMSPGVFTALTVCLLFASMARQSGAQTSLHADEVVVLKKDRTLELLSQGKVIKTYRVALGGDPVGPKARQGDHKTPEGAYVLDFRNAHSRFYKSIHISYPSEHDRALARSKGVMPGGDVFVHGLPNGYGAIGAAHRLKDWTDGCIAATDEEIDEIWKAVPDGTRIEIKP
jgi:murein L,D-transpeptidase YafK